MSSPTVSLDVLRTLHRIHKQLADLKDRRDRGPRQIRAGEAGIKQREDEVNKLREELKTMRKNIDQKQLQMKSNEQKIKDLDTKLNMAASNREYQILKDQIAADKMANSVLEDEIIEMMEQVDAFQLKIAEAEGVLKTTQEKVAASRKTVEGQAASIQGDIVRLEAELKQCEAELPEGIRETYLRLVGKKGEDALAEVVDGACGGCCQQVPAERAVQHSPLAAQFLPDLRAAAVYCGGKVRLQEPYPRASAINSAAPCSNNTLATLRPSDSASSTVPLCVASSFRVPAGSSTRPVRTSRSPSIRPQAAMGAMQPPCNTASIARSAFTAACVGG